MGAEAQAGQSHAILCRPDGRSTRQLLGLPQFFQGIAAGAILGRLAESLSLLIGFKYLIGVAALMYLASWALYSGKSRRQVTVEHERLLTY